MNSIFIGILLLTLVDQLINVQAKISVTMQDVEGVIINPEYFQNYESFINDDGTIFMNFTIIKTYPEETMVSFDLIGSTMGKYIANSGLSYLIRYCDAYLEKYSIIGDHFLLLGMTADNCPPSAGNYGNEGFLPLLDSFPDTFRPNNYLATVKTFRGTEIIYQYDAYLKVDV